MCAKCTVRDAANAGDWQAVHDAAAAQLDDHDPQVASKGKHEDADTDE